MCAVPFSCAFYKNQKFQRYSHSKYISNMQALRILVVHGNERPTYRADYIYEKAFDAFYKVHHAAASWAVARVRCEAEGTALLVPASLDEADSMPVLIANVLTRYQGVFVGMHDLYSEKSFVTING